MGKGEPGRYTGSGSDANWRESVKRSNALARAEACGVGMEQVLKDVVYLPLRDLVDDIKRISRDFIVNGRGFLSNREILAKVRASYEGRLDHLAEIIAAQPDLGRAIGIVAGYDIYGSDMGSGGEIVFGANIVRGDLMAMVVQKVVDKRVEGTVLVAEDGGSSVRLVSETSVDVAEDEGALVELVSQTSVKAAKCC